MDNKVIIALVLLGGGAGIYYFLKKKQATPSIDFTTGDFGQPPYRPGLRLDPSVMKKQAAKGTLRLAQGSDLIKMSRFV